MINEIANITRKMKNIILDMPDAAPAIPPNPNTAAISAITRNIIDHLNMISPPFYRLLFIVYNYPYLKHENKFFIILMKIYHKSTYLISV